MLKKILIIAGIFIVGIALLNLLIKSSVADTAVANKEKQKPLSTKEEQEISTLNRVTEASSFLVPLIKFIIKKITL
ncbi:MULTISPECIES: hypothetical protein [unclassified Lysinibacillus]|uniref:hypothetical protein n=1 Tax=unclassified Lysinibacillus TaxID=2636778 RepID=UPI0035DBB572